MIDYIKQIKEAKLSKEDKALLLELVTKMGKTKNPAIEAMLQLTISTLCSKYPNVLVANYFSVLEAVLNLEFHEEIERRIKEN